MNGAQELVESACMTVSLKTPSEARPHQPRPHGKRRLAARRRTGLPRAASARYLSADRSRLQGSRPVSKSRSEKSAFPMLRTAAALPATPARTSGKGRPRCFRERCDPSSVPVTLTRRISLLSEPARTLAQCQTESDAAPPSSSYIPGRGRQKKKSGQATIVGRPAMSPLTISTAPTRSAPGRCQSTGESAIKQASVFLSVPRMVHAKRSRRRHPAGAGAHAPPDNSGMRRC